MLNGLECPDRLGLELTLFSHRTELFLPYCKTPRKSLGNKCHLAGFPCLSNSNSVS